VRANATPFSLMRTGASGTVPGRGCVTGARVRLSGARMPWQASRGPETGPQSSLRPLQPLRLSLTPVRAPPSALFDPPDAPGRPATRTRRTEEHHRHAQWVDYPQWTCSAASARFRIVPAARLDHLRHTIEGEVITPDHAYDEARLTRRRQLGPTPRA